MEDKTRTMIGIIALTVVAVLFFVTLNIAITAEIVSGKCTVNNINGKLTATYNDTTYILTPAIIKVEEKK